MKIIINTPYKYQKRGSRPCFEPFVDVPYQDTSVDNSQKQAVSSGSDLTKGIYTNSESPVKVFGDSILASSWNPFTSHGNPPSHDGINVPGDASAAAQSSAAAVQTVSNS